MTFNLRLPYDLFLEATMNREKTIKTPIGLIKISAQADALTSVELVGEDVFSSDKEDASDELLEKAASQLTAYFNGESKSFDLPLNWGKMGNFRKRALEETAKIPWGEVITYGELARRAGSPNASRAAGGAVASNPFLIVVPCHRVIGSDLSLHGFSAGSGLKLKQQLLELEGHTITNQKVNFKK